MTTNKHPLFCKLIVINYFNESSQWTLIDFNYHFQKLGKENVLYIIKIESRSFFINRQLKLLKQGRQKMTNLSIYTIYVP